MESIITRDERPVVGLQVSCAAAVGAGGLTRFLPNQWVMTGRLRTIPDTTNLELDVRFESDSSDIVWAADIWHSVKKHWVLELQRLIRAKRNVANDR